MTVRVRLDTALVPLTVTVQSPSSFRPQSLDAGCVPTGPSSVLQSLCPHSSVLQSLCTHRSQLCPTVTVPPQVPALCYSHCVPTGPSSVLQSLCPHRSQLCPTVTVSSSVVQSLCPHRSQLCATVTVPPQVPALCYSHCVPTGPSCVLQSLFAGCAPTGTEVGQQ